MTDKRCGNCKHWRPEPMYVALDTYEPGWGRCNTIGKVERANYENDMCPMPVANGIYVTMDDPYTDAWIYTGENFCCNHWIEKKKTKTEDV